MRAVVRPFLPSSFFMSLGRHIVLFSLATLGLWHASAQTTQDEACTGAVSSSACATSVPVRQEVPAYARRMYRMSVDLHAGAAGIGTEATAPLTRRFDLRGGSDFFSYSTVVNSGGNAVHAQVRLRSAKLAVDWYVTHHHAFRVSPLLVFANSSHLGTSVNLSTGQSITLNDVTYYSDPADPLHGSASVDLRRVSPGVSLGLGHLVPGRGHHFSFPFEAGFYYAGSPAYKMQFAGSACVNRAFGAPICQNVQNAPDFQYNLAQFKAKYQQYVNYANFFPVLSSGVSFAF